MKINVIGIISSILVSAQIFTINSYITNDEVNIHQFVSHMAEQWLDNDTFPEIFLTDKQWEWFHSLSTYHQPANLTEGLSNPQIVHGVKLNDNCDVINTPLMVRQEWRRMTDVMRQSYIDAVNSLSSYYPDPDDPEGMSAYDIIVGMHRYAMAPGAHFGAGLLPWHREYLWRYGNALRQQGYGGDLPYWDTMLDEPLAHPADSVIFSDQHMGTARGEVQEPFGELDILEICDLTGNSTVLRNTVDNGGLASSLMYNAEKLEVIFNFTCFRDLGSGWNDLPSNSFELFHDMVHVFLGGHMSGIPCASVDPIFFLHHTYIDLIWEEFRQEHQLTDIQREYPLTNLGRPSVAEIHKFMTWDAVMLPFGGIYPLNGGVTDGMRMIEGLSTHYTTYYYIYESRPSTIVCSDDRDCTEGSDALWCNTNAAKCQGRIQEGGMCDVELPDRQCWCRYRLAQASCDRQLPEATCVCA